MDLHQVNIWKQDPSVSEIGITKTLIWAHMSMGLSDDDIEIVGMPVVNPNENGDFLLNYKESPKKFDAVHTYSVVRKVLNFYRRALNRNGFVENIKWPWNSNRLKIYPHAGLENNAYYSRNDQSLKFYYFFDEKSLDMVFTCRSYDIIAHEMGHAVLDSLKPEWYGNNMPLQTKAFHESFADLTSLFSLLSQFDICDLIITISKGNLNNANFLNSIGEQYGISKDKTNGIRNAISNVDFGKELKKENKYALSTVLTSAIYDIIIGYFNDYKNSEKYNLAESLFRVSENILDLLIKTIMSNKLNMAELLKDVAEGMYRNENDVKRKDIIANSFSKVGIKFNNPNELIT